MMYAFQGRSKSSLIYINNVYNTDHVLLVGSICMTQLFRTYELGQLKC